MLVRSRVAFLTIMAGCLLSPANADVPTEKKFKPAMVFSGTHSEIKKERFVRVLTADAWERLWEEHRGKDNQFTETDQELEINFKTHYVIGLFFGHGGGRYDSTRLAGDALHIGYHRHSGQFRPEADRRTSDEKAKDDATAPYAFVVLPRPAKELVVEEDVRSLIADPPLWKPRVKFPSLSDKKN